MVRCQAVVSTTMLLKSPSRNIKVKPEVSDQFKSGQEHYCVLRSIIDITIKNGQSVFDAITALALIATLPRRLYSYDYFNPSYTPNPHSVIRISFAPTDGFFMKNHFPPADEWLELLQSGDRAWLGRAITLVESTRPEHHEKAAELLEKCLPDAAKNPAFRLGISGAPGVGKSSFIESFGRNLIENHQKRLAVLAIDPSSSLTHGSILGDKTRMEWLAASPSAFIRPSPASGSLGGVARRTREAITLVEAAGFDTVFIETVGVGQSETAVKFMTDCFLLLLLPGAGDDLQGIKRGITELADLVAVNKTDGERAALAKQARVFYQNALHLFPANENGWQPKVMNCSALEKTGLPEIAVAIFDFEKKMKDTNFFDENRRKQSVFWLRETIENGLRDVFFQNEKVKTAFWEMEKEVLAGQISPFRAADRLLDFFQHDLKNKN